MFINLSASLLKHKQIVTTLAKAKALRGIIEPLITRSGKEGIDPLTLRRYLIAHLGGNKEAIETLINEVGPYYKSRPGGYVRVLKMGRREGDNAPRALVQLVGLSPAEVQQSA